MTALASGTSTGQVPRWDGSNWLASMATGPTGPQGATGNTGNTGSAGATATTCSAADIDTGTEAVKYVTPAAYVGSHQHSLANYNTTDQSLGALSENVVAGSTLAVPAGKLRIGSMFRYKMALTKTASGTQQSTFAFQLGTAGTTADTDVCALALPVVGTAAVDTAYVDIMALVKGPLSSSGKVQATLCLTHNLATTGFINIAGVAVTAESSNFDVTTANLIGSVSIKTGTNQAWTVKQIYSELLDA